MLQKYRKQKDQEVCKINIINFKKNKKHRYHHIFIKVQRKIEMAKTKDVILQLSGLYKIYGKKLETEIKAGDIPNHIALILDGNRRWAKRNLEINKKGHWQGADAVENLLDWCEELISKHCLLVCNISRKFR